MTTYNTQDIAKKKDLNPDEVAEVKGWMETVMGKSYDDFFEDIRDGVEICELLNKIKPGTCKKFKKSQVVFVARTNIQIFIQGCKKLGIPESDCIETRDLFDQQNLNDVVINLYAVSSISTKHNFGGPFIGIKYADKNKRNFSQETLNKSKSAVPSWNKGSIETKKKGMDGYGIVKTSKQMQQHSGVLNKWEQGAKEVNTSNIDGYGIVKTNKSSNMDGYGIVKTSKQMQQHSGVLNKWEQGAKEVNTSNIDGYGIVKTEKSMQHPSQVQGTWQKGAKNNKSSNMDGYGIVKTSKQMQQHSGVLNKWEQGAKEVNTSNIDGYGIVKTEKSMQNPSQVQGAWQKGANEV
eukprot:246859_1